MKELIGIAVLIAGIFGGTIAAERIFQEVRLATLGKSTRGLPRLAPFARVMTKAKSRPIIESARSIDEVI